MAGFYRLAKTSAVRFVLRPPVLLSNCSVRSIYRYQSTDVKKIDDEEFSLSILGGEQKGIAVAAFNRPKAKNALSKKVVELLEESLHVVEFDKDIRVFILKSDVPGIFCAGADLKERLTMSKPEVQYFVSRARGLMARLRDLPAATIAALDGAALGGGLEFSLACDFRICSDNARVGLPETKLAIIPGAGGTQLLPRLIGIAKAKELIFTGRVIDGQEAYNCGIAQHVVKQNDDGDAAYLRALSLAQEISPQGPVALKMAKKSINEGSGVDIKSALAVEELCYAQVIPTKDRLEGLKAFKEKRPPVYTGE